MKIETTLPINNGTELYLVKDTVTRPRAVVVIVHGLCEHQGRYDYVAARLNAQQINGYRFDHRGHGRSGGKRVYYDDWTEISDDVNSAVELAAQENPGLPVYVVGHSMGGYAVACFATRFPGKAAGIILSGALTRYNNPLMGKLPIAAPADTYVPNALGDGVCSDPAVGEAYTADPYVEKQISVGLMNSLGGGISYLKENPARFTDPVLIMHGQNDGLVSPLDSLQLYAEIASQDKALRVYAGMCHEIFNEFDKDEPIGDMINWLNKHI
ncbi:MAG: alpha/beta hydrolase [Clostridiales bacterium]|nr:alpha/beta hydrolase [Clostridiales bacterium]